MKTSPFEKVSVDSLKPIKILFRRDVYDLAVFLLRAFDAQETTMRGRGRPTLQGLARHYANLVHVNAEAILETFQRHGLPEVAVVEFEKDMF